MSNVYRAYVLNAAGGIHRPAVILDADSDAAAIAAAGRLSAERSVEVWQGTRLVKVITKSEP